MDTQKYLQSVLTQHTIESDSPEMDSLREEKEKVEKLLRKEFDESTIDIQYAGSYKKGTMIQDSYDLDIICYFNHDDKSPGETIEDIYNNVKVALEKEYIVEPKKSSLRLKGTGGIDFHIDVVPGRFMDDTKEDVFLYQSFGGKGLLKTNLNKHISHIKNSKVVNTIKLVKVWKQINSINVKTFVLELLVIKILEEKKDEDGLDVCLVAFWEKIKESVDNIAVEDPANPSGNDLSHLFDESTKAFLSSVAEKTIGFVEDDNWEDIFGSTEKIDDADKISSIANIQKDDNAPIPWCNV